LTGIEPRGHCAVPGEKAGNNLGGRYNGNRELKCAWSIQWGDYLLLSEHIPERDPLRNKRARWHHFPPLPLSMNTEPTVGSSTVPKQAA